MDICILIFDVFVLCTLMFRFIFDKGLVCLWPVRLFGLLDEEELADSMRIVEFIVPMVARK